MSTVDKLRFFDSHEAAKVYAGARPYFHPIVMERVKILADLETPLDNGLDVGCGTGLSTRALRLLATHVLGTDISAGMLTNAEEAPGVRYALAPAEQQPVQSESQDIVTISSAFHWLDAEKFLNEVKRVLKPGGPLVVYENGFSGQMVGHPDFSTWLHEVKLRRFPSPARRKKFSLEEVPQRFEAVANESYENEVNFTAAGLVEYFLTQSNVIAKVEAGETTFEEARIWLSEHVLRFFTGGQGRFRFVGTIDVLRKS